MKLYVWRGETTNFGDELNTWLMPRVFPDFFDEDEADLFLGIGSVIFDIHPAGSRKIVFGSGYAGYTALPQFDGSWRFHGVRGPRTARACGLGPEQITGDAAILMHNYRPVRTTAKGMTFMPHFHSADRGNWEQACALAGIRFIDPHAPVQEVLDAIAASETVIAEAMHGAIVADAFRIPWIPILPIHRDHRGKWHDWAEALDIELEPHTLGPSSLAGAWVAGRGGRGHGGPLAKAKGLVGALDQVFIRLAAKRLSQLAKAPPMLSTDAALAKALNRLEARAAEIRRDYPR